MAKTTMGSDLTDDKDVKPKDDEKQTTGTPHTTSAKTWRQRLTIAENNQKNMFQQWADNYQMMYAIKNYKNMAVWKSKLFIPLMSYKVWTMIAKILAMRPGFSVKIYDKTYSLEDRKRIDKANLKLEYDYDNPKLDEPIRDRLFDTFSDAVICGTGFANAQWKPYTEKIYKHFKNDDDSIDYTKHDVTERDTGYNDLDPVNAFDVFAAPGKRSFEAKPWYILKHPATPRADILSSGMYDDKTELIKRLKPAGKTKDWVAKLKQSRNSLIGKSGDDQDQMDDTVDSFDLYECVERTEEGIFITTYMVGIDEDKKSSSDPDTPGQDADDAADNWHIIRDEKQPNWHQKYPLRPVYIRRRPHDSWGESVFEITEGMANGYNDIVNQLADNLNVVGNGGILMHNTSTIIYDFYYGPGGEVRYSGDKPEFENPQTPDMEIFQALLNILEGGIDKATVSPYASGTPADATDATQGTATGISKLQEAAGDVMTFMKTNAMQFLKGVGHIWLENNRQFLDDNLAVEVQRGGRTRRMVIGREDFTDNMICVIDEALMQPATKEERLNRSLEWVKTMLELVEASKTMAEAAAEDATIINKPKPMLLDMQKIAREISDDYSKPNFDQYLYTGESDDDEQSNVNVVNAIRAAVDEDKIDADTAQQIIDGIEQERAVIVNAAQQAAAAASQAGGPEAPTEPAPTPV